MKILDRYILRRFFITLVYALVSFVLVVIFVDMVGNLGKFIDKDVPRLVIIKYYVFYIPYILILVLPIAMLLASLFSMGQMARYNELSAIKSTGISLYRLLLPLFAFGIVMSALALVFSEKVVPFTNQGKSLVESEYLDASAKGRTTRATNIYLRDKQDRRLFVGYYNHQSKSAQKVSIHAYDGNQIVERLDAKRMQWRDNRWTLYDGFRRKFDKNQLSAARFDSLYDEKLDIEPDELLKVDVKPEDMSFDELRVFIHEVKRNGGDPQKWQVDLQFKLSLPLASFIMVLFGAPLASNKQRSGAIFGLIVSMIVCLIYYGFTKFIQTLGQTGTLSPLIAAWCTNLAFFMAGIMNLLLARK